MSTSLEQAAAQLRGQIGEVKRTHLGCLNPRDTTRFAVATGETESRYFDSTAAHAAGYDFLAVPPLYLSSTREWGAGPMGEDLKEDGTTTDVGLPVGIPVRVLGGGQSLTFEHDIVAGTWVTMESAVTGVEKKSSRSGDLLVVSISRTYLSDEGTVLVRCHESRVLR